MKAKREVFTAIALLLCALVGDLGAADKIKINVRQSDAAIRQQLLQLTPLGMPIRDVYQILQSRLHRDSRIVGGPEKPHPFKGQLGTEIGHYHEPRSFSEGFLLFPTVVQTSWSFDRRQKLRDIHVRRFVRAW
jgi:hypothetical protein